MRANIQILIIAILAAFTWGCSSQPVIPDSGHVNVSHRAADDDCKDLGKVTGATLSAQGKAEDALEDMKKEAANKGANYVVIGQYSATGTSVTGMAYQCP